MKVDILVIGAMDIEVNELAEMIEDRVDECVSGVIFHTGSLFSKKIAVAKCGIGKVFAALCTEAGILRYSPSLIINTGVGGALATALRPTDVVIADKLCQHDMDTSAIGDPKGLVSGINRIFFETDARAVSILKKAAETNAVNAMIGTVATGDKFISDRADKENIVSLFDAVACEMEGGAVAHVAFVNSVPFAVVRAISDSADGEATMEYPTFLPIAARNSTKMTLALIKEY